MPNMGVINWELIAKDVKKQATFYSELFGWKFEFDATGKWASVDTGGLNGTASQFDQPSSDFLLHVYVPNVQAILDKVPGVGGRVINPIIKAPDGTAVAFIADTEGIVWGLIQHKAAAPGGAAQPEAAQPAPAKPATP
jgi:uncharacterized protein